MMIEHINIFSGISTILIVGWVIAAIAMVITIILTYKIENNS